MHASIPDPAVARAFDAFAPAVRKRLLAIRAVTTTVRWQLDAHAAS